MSSNKNSGEWSWGRSLLLKIGILGLGVAVVLWASWPQPHIGTQDGFPLLPVAQQSTTIQAASSGLSSTAMVGGDRGRLSTAGPVLLVDLNLGSHIELQLLPGIGVKLAERIVAYRSNHGAFQEVDDLVKVTGIGQKRLKRLEPYVKVTESKKVS